MTTIHTNFRPKRRITGPSTTVKHSIVIGRHKTSISMEDMFWKALKAIAATREITLSTLVGEIDERCPAGSTLSSAVRVHVFAEMKERLETLEMAIGVEYSWARRAQAREWVEA